MAMIELYHQSCQLSFSRSTLSIPLDAFICIKSGKLDLKSVLSSDIHYHQKVQLDKGS